MGKRNWWYIEEREASWHRVIKSKYEDEEGGCRSCDVDGAHGVGVWKVIRMDRC